MSDISTKRTSIEQVASMIHTGAETLSTREEAIKNFISGGITTVDAPATTYAFTHSDNDEYLKLSGLTGATTINMTASSDLVAGSTVTIDVTQNGTGRNLVAGTGILPAGATLITGVASDRDIVTLKYNGTEWVQMGASVKIVDAA